MPILSNLRKYIADPDVAIDLGTANTRFFAQGHGLIADEPSIVPVIKSNYHQASDPPNHNHHKNGHKNGHNGSTKIIGAAQTVRPLRGGVIVDVDAAISLLTPLFYRLRRLGRLRPRTLACTPTDATEQERNALIEATRRAGASHVVIAPEPLAAALGAGINISDSYSQMIVDIGYGVTDIAVVRAGSLLVTSAVRTACFDLHTVINKRLAEKLQVRLDQHETERLLHQLSNCYRSTPDRIITLQGIDLCSGNTRSIEISQLDLGNCLLPTINIIVQAVKSAVGDLPASIANEVVESGILLTGGGATLPGIADLIAAETALDVKVANDPLHSVINGASKMLDLAETSHLWMS